MSKFTILMTFIIIYMYLQTFCSPALEEIKEVYRAYKKSKKKKVKTNPFKNIMKVRPSVKRICKHCRIVRRYGKVWVLCKNPKHKQRQG